MKAQITADLHRASKQIRLYARLLLSNNKFVETILPSTPAMSAARAMAEVKAEDLRALARRLHQQALRRERRGLT